MSDVYLTVTGSILVCRNGGAIYHGLCDKSEENLGECFWVGIPNTLAASMVLIEDNLAGGDQGGVGDQKKHFA